MSVVMLLRLLVICIVFNDNTAKAELDDENNKSTISIDMSKVIDYETSIGPKIILNKKLKITSFCVRLYHSKVIRVQIPFYSSKPHNDKFRLFLNFEDGNGFVSINHQLLIFKISFQLTPFVYTHFCFSQNGTHYMIASDGLLRYSSKVPEAYVPQLNDETEIGEITFGPNARPWDKRVDFFNGAISELNLFSNSFNVKELIEISGSCEEILIGNKSFIWSDLKANDIVIPQSIDVKVKEFAINEICSRSNIQAIDLLPIKTTLDHAFDVCSSLGGEVLMPTLEDVDLMEQKLKNSSTFINIMDKICENTVWLPIFKSENLISWLDYKSKSQTLDIPYEMLNNGQDIQQCAGYIFQNEKRQAHDLVCSSKICTVCHWKTHITFSMRGLSKESQIEDHYVLFGNYHYGAIIGK